MSKATEPFQENPPASVASGNREAVVQFSRGQRPRNGCQSTIVPCKGTRKPRGVRFSRSRDSWFPFREQLVRRLATEGCALVVLHIFWFSAVPAGPVKIAQQFTAGSPTSSKTAIESRRDD